MAELLQQLVTKQAERRPDAIALVMNDERISYAALEEASNRLARQLRAVGCVRGDRVCFLMPKSPAAIVSELGILKADCVYTPLDPSSPAPRLAKIVAACEPRCVLIAGATGSMTRLLGDTLAEANLSSAKEIVNLVRACDYYPFSSSWGFPRARLGEREIGVIKARMTGELCDAAPGTVGRIAPPAGQVACADEWIWVDKALIEGKFLPAADILKSGARMDYGN